MIFIVFHKDGTRETYSNRYDENDERERDAAWDDVYEKKNVAIIKLKLISLSFL